MASGVAAFVFAARTGWLTPSEAALRARYELPESQYASVDGQTVHFTDQGEGPAVVLVHGSYGSLRNWNEWAEALVPGYRVIRFGPAGTVGPAPDGRTGRGTGASVIDALTEGLA